MTDKQPDSSLPEPEPTSKAPSRSFQRRPWSERAKSGRTLPPGPAWMQKPLKPPPRKPSSD